MTSTRNLRPGDVVLTDATGFPPALWSPAVRVRAARPSDAATAVPREVRQVAHRSARGFHGASDRYLVTFTDYAFAIVPTAGTEWLPAPSGQQRSIPPR